jgi:hypothetical protein
MLCFSLSLIIGQDQYDAYHQRPQRVQGAVSPNVNQDPYRQQQHQGLINEVFQ